MPKAMIIAIIVGSVSFLVPLMYGAVIDTDYDKWQAVHLETPSNTQQLTHGAVIGTEYVQWNLNPKP